MNKIIIVVTVALLAGLAIAGGVQAGLSLDGESGIFLNTTASTLSRADVEFASHAINMDHLGTVTSFGVAAGLTKRLEVGVSRMSTDMSKVEDQTLFSVKAQLIEETPLMPAVAAWAVYRDVDGLDSSTDLGVSASKIFKLAERGVLVNVGLRSSKAVCLGLFGFQDDRELCLEGSAAIFVTPKLAIGAEFKQQPGERAWTDLALRWSPSANLSLDFGIANLNSELDNQVALAISYSKF